MTIELTREQQEIISGLVATGRFADDRDVLGQSLKLIQERELRLSQLRAEIQRGVDSGEPAPLDADDLVRRARKRYEQRKRTTR